ncbi:putative 4-hydroxy-2-oxoglutarate aldolase, mitochondrial [Lachnellula hyalina]|uniref:Putative 4-hydroxy-2-oxoglutarate aldolase, mitochondrial n=1 Tax=Lachnellula hyalina TaxID=1316788 RepID=A0A8H8R3N5_9HELO|nr:putative 4-hydroxy-2-oxoglutarate aldolase, mitochondrial [Lachnellula hyalina]TVY27066.1 putative 4-hydroxy-2-oxoglutarate aldolase, mitochondrial [Lachnellula hyalina]
MRHSNSPVPSIRPITAGFYVPIVTPFSKETEGLDYPALRQHVTWLAKCSVAGIVTQGSNGEAVHLSHTERQIVTSTTREALNSAGFDDLPIIVGCGAQSTLETIELCSHAAQAGGDAALVLPPSYYHSLYNDASILDFFADVADASPIPILIYNYPGATSGFDMDSDAIISLSKHPNIIGCKLTCGNTGKLNRIVAATSASSKPAFLCMGGSADFTTQALVGGGSGIIGGLGNIAPRACVKVFDLYKAGKIDEAVKMQGVVARGDWVAIRTGIVGTKAAMESYLGYGGCCRKPVPRPTKEEVERYVEGFAELFELEKTLVL